MHKLARHLSVYSKASASGESGKRRHELPIVLPREVAYAFGLGAVLGNLWALELRMSKKVKVISCVMIALTPFKTIEA